MPFNLTVNWSVFRIAAIVLFVLAAIFLFVGFWKTNADIALMSVGLACLTVG